jgi:molecular chaperone GrpE
MTNGNNKDSNEKEKEDQSSESDASEEKMANNAETELQEVKKLEEKEHYELDFFSKEELVKKCEDLEKELKELKERAEKLEKELKESKNKYMHLQADFENAQKRWDKNRQNYRIEYTASVLKSFLPLYDSFKKAIESGTETERIILMGFYNQFMNIFKSYGAEPIKVNINDQFDYNLHEALSIIEKDNVPENTVLEVIQDGFKYGKEVIRYAKVIISRKPKPKEPEPKEEVEEKKKEDQSEKEEENEKKEAKAEKKDKKVKKEK